MRNVRSSSPSEREDRSQREILWGNVPLNGERDGGSGVLDQIGAFSVGHLGCRASVYLSDDVASMQFPFGGRTD